MMKHLGESEGRKSWDLWEHAEFPFQERQGILAAEKFLALECCNVAEILGKEGCQINKIKTS